MSFTGNEPHEITLAEAAALTANHRTNHPNEILGLFFGKTAILEILNQENCVGIRAYYGEDNQGANKLVIVGVDANKNDLINGKIADYGIPCPQRCSNSNSLNS